MRKAGTVLLKPGNVTRKVGNDSAKAGNVSLITPTNPDPKPFLHYLTIKNRKMLKNLTKTLKYYLIKESVFI